MKEAKNGKTQIITGPSQRELKEHGSYQFPFLVSYERLPVMNPALFYGIGTGKLN